MHGAQIQRHVLDGQPRVDDRRRVPDTRAGLDRISTSSRLVPRNIHASRLVPTQCPRRRRRVAATRPRGIFTSPPRRRRDSSPTDYPRRGVAATRLRGLSTSRPRRRRDSSPGNVVSRECPRGERTGPSLSPSYSAANTCADRAQGETTILQRWRAGAVLSKGIAKQAPPPLGREYQ